MDSYSDLLTRAVSTGENHRWHTGNGYRQKGTLKSGGLADPRSSPSSYQKTSSTKLVLGTFSSIPLSLFSTSPAQSVVTHYDTVYAKHIWSDFHWEALRLNFPPENIWSIRFQLVFYTNRFIMSKKKYQHDNCMGILMVNIHTRLWIKKIENFFLLFITCFRYWFSKLRNYKSLKHFFTYRLF